MARVHNAVEILNHLSRALERYRRQTDRQTTDGRATANSEREGEFTFAKNGSVTLTTLISHPNATTSHGLSDTNKDARRKLAVIWVSA